MPATSSDITAVITTTTSTISMRPQQQQLLGSIGDAVCRTTVRLWFFVFFFLLKAPLSFVCLARERETPAGIVYSRCRRWSSGAVCGGLCPNSALVLLAALMHWAAQSLVGSCQNLVVYFGRTVESCRRRRRRRLASSVRSALNYPLKIGRKYEPLFILQFAVLAFLVAAADDNSVRWNIVSRQSINGSNDSGSSNTGRRR